MAGRWNIPRILQRMLEVLLIVSPVVILAMPFIFMYVDPEFVNRNIAGGAQDRWLAFIFIEICSVCCWFILLFLQKLLKTVNESSPFVYKNVLFLKYISYICAFTAFVLIVKTFVDFSVMTPVVAILGLLSCLFCQTLAWVFDKAIRLKDENDLTI